MSDTAAPAGTPAPAAPPATPDPSTVAQTPVPTPASPDPTWLAPRLENAKRTGERAVLEALGVKDAAEAKAAIAAYNASKEAQKSIEQRALEAEQRATAALSESDRLRAVATEQAARMLVVLTPEQQDAVKAIAGDDPALQLRAIGALGPTWAAERRAAQPATPQTPAATTTTPPTAPASGGTAAPPDHRSAYAQQSNPFARAAYGYAHPEVYEPKRA